MNNLITGIHGFVGTNLVSGLNQHHTIYGLDIVSPQKDGKSNERIKEWRIKEWCQFANVPIWKFENDG